MKLVKVKVSREELIRAFDIYGTCCLNNLPENIFFNAKLLECENEWQDDYSKTKYAPPSQFCKKCGDLRFIPENPQPRLLAPALIKTYDGFWSVTNFLYTSEEECRKHLRIKEGYQIKWPARLDPVTGFYEVEND